ncbi:MAG: DUF2207 domain-containing protein [Bacteroidales bacterium]|nr:DUF2207 domain-containing protein [Bacteroidales bacterium]
MMLLASGSDKVLQDKEFSKWSSRHTREVNEWVNRACTYGQKDLQAQGCMSGTRYLSQGQAKARGCIGFRKFLSDFTLCGEREVGEVALWKDYLIFGALFGIADKVASQLKDINPQYFDEQSVYDYPTIYQVLWMSDRLSRAITNAQATAAASSGKGGFGGSTSFGGGGGFSGGGFGGGGR